MTRPDDNTRIDQSLLDLLVDGELDPERRRDLLLRLESEPDGWRRCALAFLEAQAWREALSVLACEAAPAPPRVASRVALPPRRGLQLAALVAGLLAAFFLGWAAGGRRPTPAGGGSGDVGIAQAPEPLGSAQSPEPPAADGVQTVATLHLVGEGVASEAVPILAGPGLDERWALAQPPALPEYVRLQWERRGYRVEQNRRLIAMDLDDGRRLAIPVDEVQLHYVGHPAY
ncbi:MAG: hypothetical protein IRY99_05570 [Isosphaeraceae bacterium]|nr:hypothetical protein [Isosphaeraceae bacterium]